MLSSPFARQREATSAYSHYHTGMQEQTQKTWRGLDVISDVEVYEKTPRTLHAQLNMERDFESIAVWVSSHQGVSPNPLWNRVQ